MSSSPEKQTCPDCSPSHNGPLGDGFKCACPTCLGIGYLTSVSGDNPKLINKSAESYLTATPVASEAKGCERCNNLLRNDFSAETAAWAHSHRNHENPNFNDPYIKEIDSRFKLATPDEQPKRDFAAEAEEIMANHKVHDYACTFCGQPPAKPIETDSELIKLRREAYIAARTDVDGDHPDGVYALEAVFNRIEALIAQREAFARQEGYEAGYAVQLRNDNDFIRMVQRDELEHVRGVLVTSEKPKPTYDYIEARLKALDNHSA